MGFSPRGPEPKKMAYCRWIERGTCRHGDRKSVGDHRDDAAPEHQCPERDDERWDAQPHDEDTVEQADGGRAKQTEHDRERYRQPKLRGRLGDQYGAEPEHRPDRLVELAGDHQQCH